MKHKFFQIPVGDSIGAENEFILVPKLKLGNAALEAPASRILEAGASRIWVPIYAPEGKPELGNQGKNVAL